jgi:methionine-rich copper-binding protein CopC
VVLPSRVRGMLLAVAALLLAGLATLWSPAVASAHAAYVSSNPAANAVLKTAPTVITLHFAENVNPTGSEVFAYDAKGKQVSTGPARVDRGDLKTMTVGMQGDDSETYLVVWHNVSADDGDPDTGAFTFIVSATATPQPTTTSAGGSGGTHTSSSGSTGVPGWVAALIGILGLIVGAAGGIWYSRRAT